MQVITGMVFRFMRPPVRCLRKFEGEGLMSKALLRVLGIVL